MAYVVEENKWSIVYIESSLSFHNAHVKTK